MLPRGGKNQKALDLEQAERLLLAGIFPVRGEKFCAPRRTTHDKALVWYRECARRRRQDPRNRESLRANQRRYEHSAGLFPKRQWTAQELKFLDDHRQETCRVVAFALGRSVRSVQHARTFNNLRVKQMFRSSLAPQDPPGMTGLARLRKTSLPTDKRSHR